MRPPMPNVILSRRAKIALSVVAILIVLLVLVVKLSGTYIDLLWFREVGASGVFTTVFWTRVVLFAIFGVLMAAVIGGNLVVAYLIKPPFRPMSPEQQNLQNYVLMIEPRRRLILVAVAVIAFLAAGASAQGDWAAWQTWLHGENFGQRDPQFHLDVSFFAWDLPVYRLMLGFGFTALIFSIILVIGVHYLTGAIRLQTPGPKITLSARRHLTVLVFAFMLLKAVAYWLDRYSLVFSERGGRFTGASYTDVHSALPAKTILFWITLILAVGVLASIWLRSALLPGIGFIVLIVLSILMGGIYPAIVQQVSVKPNASTKEAPYIKRNITATRDAYGIVTKDASNPSGSVTYQNYPVTGDPDPAKLDPTDATLSNLRVQDPNVVSPTFTQQQAQQLSGVYGFPTKLDVDRYTTTDSKGVTTKDDYIVGVRELKADSLTGDQTNWINQHTNYTHGYGYVAARASSTLSSAASYADGGIPQTGELNKAVPLKTPQVYFGELMSDYAVVGAKGTPREFDGTGAKKITYQGKGGISLSSPFTKLAFALDEKETSFLLNDAVSADGAKALINRDPRERVKKVAPFLTVDGDAYPFIDTSSGHIKWMVDAYTTTANFPYSERRSLSDLTDNSLTRTSRTNGQANTQVNYIRNSVKATVDAYDGTVKLYQWDTKDPVLKTWMKVFPGLVSSRSSMPTSVRDHVRYPEDLFEVQRGLLGEYHVSDPTTFYNQSNNWEIPKDASVTTGGNQPPYYVLADSQTEGVTGAQFQLTSPMQVNNKENLAAYITVDSDPSAYGKITILNGFTGTVQGPGQVSSNGFQSDQRIVEFRTNARNGSSTVILGNLLTLPVNGNFLYVQPLYTQKENTAFPTLQKVQVYFNGKVGFGNNVSAALADLRTGTGSSTGSGTGGTSTTPTTSPSGSTTPSTPASSGSASTTAPASGSLPQLIAQAQQAKTALDAAYATRDQAKIGAAQASYNAATDRVLAALGRSASATASPAR